MLKFVQLVWRAIVAAVPPIGVAILGMLFLSTVGVRADGDVEGCTEDDFDAALFSGGLVTFTQDCTITLTMPISIAINTMIDAQGHNVVISGDNALQLFEVDSGVEFQMFGITISDGLSTNAAGALLISEGATVVLSNCTFSGNSAFGTNGAAGQNGANGQNSAGNGTGGTSGGPAFGGAIYNSGDLTLIRCTLATNTVTGGNGGNGGNGGDASRTLGTGGNGGNGGVGSGGFGAAIYNVGTLSISDCTFAGNLARGGNGGFGGTNGGGFANGRPGSGAAGGVGAGSGIYSIVPVILNRSTFNGNTANGGNGTDGGTQSNGLGATGARGGDSFGAGAYLSGNLVTNITDDSTNIIANSVTNCTLFGNGVIGGTAGNGGPGNLGGGSGGNGGNATGGGLYCTGTVRVVNCTFSMGSAIGGTNGVSGPGPFGGSDGSPGASRGGNVANGGGTFSILNTIIATNLAGKGGYGTFTDAGNNISADNSITLGATSKKSTDPRIGTLANNGGPTMTISLATNSPAVDAGKDPGCPPIDQRGVSRPVGSHCDVGAYEATFKPGILTQPMSQTQTNGGTVTFFVQAIGVQPLNYRWRFNSASVNNGNRTNYTIANITITNAGAYDVVISNSFGSITSAPAILTVAFPAAISVQPTNIAVLAGSDATFSVVAAGDSPLAYQWYFNVTNPIPIATSSSYTVVNAQPVNVGTYSVVVANAFGSITSAVVTLTVNQAPTIGTQPAAQTVDLGTSVTFSVGATGTQPLRYQWYYNLTTVIAGATGPTWTFTAQTNNAGGYSVIVANDFGSIQSDNAMLTVCFRLFSIGGRVLDGTNGLSGVTVSGAGMNSAVTDAGGYYTISDVHCGDYFVFASKAGYQFSPPQEVIVGPDASNVNFTVTAQLHTISGRITANGAGLPGVSVFGGQLTDANGFFNLSLSDGSYTLAPQLAGYGFSPSKQTVTVPPDSTNVNFLAGPLITSITRRSDGAIVIALYSSGTTRLQASTNFMDWISVFTNNAPYQFIDTKATNFPVRFYRAIQP